MGTLILHLWSPLPVFTETARNLFWSLHSSLPFCSLRLLQFQAGLQVSFPTTGGPSPHFPSSLDLLGNIRIIPPNQAVSGISFLCSVLPSMIAECMQFTLFWLNKVTPIWKFLQITLSAMSISKHSRFSSLKDNDNVLKRWVGLLKTNSLSTFQQVSKLCCCHIHSIFPHPPHLFVFTFIFTSLFPLTST